MAGRRLSRRAFIGGAVVGTAGAAGAGFALWPTDEQQAVLRQQVATIADPSGTTLRGTILRSPGAGYRTLTEGPGWPTVVRDDLATAKPGRIDAREPLAAIAHLTDIHIIDAQSPGRVEFLDRYAGPLTAAFRPQETLTCHVGSSMVQRINSLAGAPITGRAFDCAVSTGDNIDNQQLNETRWFMTLLDGGTLAANSGDPDRYEGVQDGESPDLHYWHTEEAIEDEYATSGFPARPELLDAAIVPFETPPIGMRWYSTYGNHDGLLQGNLPTTELVGRLLTLDRKIMDVMEGQSSSAFIGTMFAEPATMLRDVEALRYPLREVTPDPDRRPLGPREWVQLHLDSPVSPGPAGHGYTEDHLELPAVYYEFEIAPGVLGIGLDTGGYNSGSIGEDQLMWLRERLEAVHSTYWDESGTVVRTDHADQLVLLFSHYGPFAMNQPMRDPANLDERRVLGDEVVVLLHRFPNVIGWINGHHHSNTVQPVADPSGLGKGWWDINTASHVDFPQQARLVEVVDNKDGTLSIFCTMLEHLAPVTPPEEASGVLDLASLCRELAANDVHRREEALGTDVDLNVELLLADPRRRTL
jgi:metallophosphoesterase (TIGR03767 family)